MLGVMPRDCVNVKSKKNHFPVSGMSETQLLLLNNILCTLNPMERLSALRPQVRSVRQLRFHVRLDVPDLHQGRIRGGEDQGSVCSWACGRSGSDLGGDGPAVRSRGISHRGSCGTRVGVRLKSDLCFLTCGWREGGVRSDICCGVGMVLFYEKE